MATVTAYNAQCNVCKRRLAPPEDGVYAHPVTGADTCERCYDDYEDGVPAWLSRLRYGLSYKVAWLQSQFR